MIQTLSFTEMNQAVPGSLLSPRMEQHFECEVPSPSQWSDPCRSPLSLHSPVHYPCESEKVKEEPYSPNYIYYHMSNDTRTSSGCTNINEASINLADLLSENGSLIAQVQQLQHSPQPSYTPQAIVVSPPPQEAPIVKQEEEYGDFFLDSLVDVKKEIEDESRFAVTSTTPTVPTSGSVVPPVSSSVPTSVSHSTGDGLKTIELMALDYCRQNVETVSQKLNVSKDPTAWSVANVKSWLEYEADQQRLPMPKLEHWTYTGADLVRLTEAQFRELIPQGGELLFAILEYWRLDIPSRSSSQTVQYQTLSSPIQPLSVNVQSHSTQQYYNVPQMYQSPSHSQVPSPLFSPTSMMLSPVTPQAQQQLSPSPKMTVPHQQPPSPSTQNLPTTVIHADRQQQLKRQSVESPKTPCPKRQRSQSPSYPISTSSFLEESCVDMTALLQQTGDTPKPQSPSQPSTTTIEPTRDDADSDDEGGVEKPAPSTGGSGRGGTHIHLWQFLKELLLHPQRYAPYIRWLDRQAGIFKIEDSVRVAHLWGKRKNRPAMNYDKLSRSIRQYYKKGIMKKTERSQRLVYQFCHPYGV